jgi:signal transduction histidine kinase
MKKRILIVDDSPLVHGIYGESLEAAGYGVLHAVDGVEAINKAFTECPDLILLDINMPKINGYQVCRLLKDHPATSHIPIIIETSKESAAPVSDPRQWSFATGADGYMDKGESDDLLGFIRPFLEKAPSPVEAPSQPPLSEIEIMTYLSRLLDKQLYADITRLKELDERKSAFVENVSHEFRSPLGIIKGNLYILRESFKDVLDDKRKRSFDSAMRTVDRLARLVSDLLDLAKIEAGKMKLDREPLDVRDLLKEIVETYAVLIEEKRMNVACDFEDCASVLADRDRLSQVFINIFNNSLKFTPEGGRIILKAYDGADGVRVEIEDNGSGMDPGDLEKIFDKFERVTAEKREGTGLGLPIARHIVVLHGGRIWAESEPGKGSRFIIVLPRASAAERPEN